MVISSKKILVIIKACTITLVLCEQNTNSIIIPDKVEFPQTCIENIVRKYFSCGTLITLINPINDAGQFISSLTANNCYTLILKSFTSNQWLVSTEVYIILAEDYLTLSHGMINLSRDILWNPRANFIVFLNNFNNTDLGDIFDIFLKHKIYTTILIKEEIDATMLYSYLPFADDNCGVDFDADDIIQIGDCNDVDIIECFPDTQSEKWSNCRLKVVASEDIPNFIFDTKNIKGGEFIQGIEQYVLETFEEKEHVFIDYVIVPDDLKFGVVLPNGTATGLLSTLQNNQADIAAGGFILMKNRIELFDFIWGYNFAAFEVFTPAFEKNSWENVYMEFSPFTWILIVISYCSMSVISKLLTKNQYQCTYLMLRIWGYLYGNTNSKFYKQKGMKVLMMFWILFTFFICNFYNTALYSLITRYNQVFRQINDEQLSSLPYEPCISETTRIYFLFAFNQSLPESAKYPECMYSQSSLGFVASRSDLYCIEMEYTYSLHEYKYINDEGNTKLDSWSFSINNVISLYVTRGFAFQEKIQNYARQMYETGLLMNQLNKIRRDIGPAVSLYTKQFNNVSVLDLRAHFAILLLGSLLATISFIFEVWYGKKKKLNKRKIETPKIKFTH